MARKTRCYVCGIVDSRPKRKDAWGFICDKCYKRGYHCFACHRQIEPGRGLRYENGRLVCPSCARRAVAEIPPELLTRLQSELCWFPRARLSFSMVQAKDLPHRRGRRRVGSWGACERLPNLKRGQRHYLVKILFGFPPEIFRAVVVHELFHAWLGENGLSDRFKPDTCEWLCEHMSCLYLSESGAGKPWRQVIAMSRDYYRYWRAKEYKGMTSSQIVQALKK